MGSQNINYGIASMPLPGNASDLINQGNGRNPYSMPLYQIASIYYPRLNFSNPVNAYETLLMDIDNYREFNTDTGANRLEQLLNYLQSSENKDETTYKNDSIVRNSLIKHLYPYHSSDFKLGNPYTKGYIKTEPIPIKTIDAVLQETNKNEFEIKPKCAYKDYNNNWHWVCKHLN